jgi:hypothetical protein
MVDYYQIIKNPVSLNQVKKRVNGIVGRTEHSGQSLYRSWDAFENEIDYIWQNARTYNEDGSDICNMAKLLEVRFSVILCYALY